MFLRLFDSLMSKQLKYLFCLFLKHRNPKLLAKTVAALFALLSIMAYKASSKVMIF
jgi:hypothetical protein